VYAAAASCVGVGYVGGAAGARSGLERHRGVGARRAIASLTQQDERGGIVQYPILSCFVACSRAIFGLLRDAQAQWWSVYVSVL
jgi:hypothetical protein